MTDHAALAVRAWGGRESSTREFAEHAALSGLSAAEIARRVRETGKDCSDSQAEKYMNAYRLMYRMRVNIEDAAEEITQFWNLLSPTHWVRLAEKESVYNKADLENRLTLDRCWEHIQAADSSSSRAFAAFLDDTYNGVPKWRRDLLRAVDILGKFDEQDYVSEIPPVIRKRLRVIFQRTARLIARVLSKDDSEAEAEEE